MLRVVLIVLLLTPSASTLAQRQQIPREPGRISLRYENNDYSISGSPRWRVTVERDGLEWECIEACADAGPRWAPITAEAFVALVRAVHAADFFNQPRYIRSCIDCGADTMTYSDDWRRHDVTIDGRAGPPALDALRKQVAETAVAPFSRLIEVRLENYQEMLRRGEAIEDAALEHAAAGAAGGYPADVFHFLLKLQLPITRAVWMHASGAPEPLRALLRVKTLDPRGETARAMLVRAALGSVGNTQPVDVLLKHGVSVNARDPDTGMTPLINARWVEMQKLLLSRGADLRATDDRGRSALWHVSRYADDESGLEFLISRGAAVDQPDVDGVTPVMRAAQTCAADNIERLTKAGANIRGTDKRGRTVLMMVPDSPRCVQTRAEITRLTAR